MTLRADIAAKGADVRKHLHGELITYQEPGGAAQSAITAAIAKDFRVVGVTAEKDWEFKEGDLTITNWVGAKLTDTDTHIYTIRSLTTAPNGPKLTGVRPIGRN